MLCVRPHLTVTGSSSAFSRIVPYSGRYGCSLVAMCRSDHRSGVTVIVSCASLIINLASGKAMTLRGFFLVLIASIDIIPILALCSTGGRKPYYPARLGIESPPSDQQHESESAVQLSQHETDASWCEAHDSHDLLSQFSYPEELWLDGIHIEQYPNTMLDSDLAQATTTGSSWHDPLSVDVSESSQPSSPTDSFFEGLPMDSSVAPMLMAQDLSTSNEALASSSYLHPQRYLPVYDWQKNLSREKIREIHKRIISHWPPDLDTIIARRWDRYASRHLNRHPEIVQGILRNDLRVWQQLFKWCTPEAMDRRSRKYGKQSRLTKDEKKRYLYTMSVHWMAGSISHDERDKIVNRLSQEWKGITPLAVQNRLNTYAGHCGKIQSPEPLLGDDEILFKKAAEIIFFSSDGRRGDLHPEAGSNDILHQYSPTYSIMTPEGHLAHIPYERKHRRPSAKRYHTMHSWLDKLTTAQIDYVHNAIAAHWVEELTVPRRGSYFVRVNEFIEQDTGVEERILGGDDEAAWRLARMTAELPQFMKSAKEYQPSGFFQQTPKPPFIHYE